MLLSIVVPVYNAGSYLRDCLDSIVSQIAPDADDVEIICVDDGSTDSSPLVLDNYAGACPSVRVIHQENGGITSARNRGLSLARGAWVMFVDHDDVVAAGTIEVIRRVGLVASDIVYFDFDEFTASRAPSEPGSAASEEIVDISDQIGKLQEDCLNRFRANTPAMAFMRLVTPWAKLYRRDFLAINELQFREDVHHAEDIIFNVECLDRARSAVRMDRVVLHHRLLLRSEGHRYNPKKIEYCKGALRTMSALLPSLRNQEPDWEVLYRYRVLWELLYCVYLGPFHPDNPHDLGARKGEFRDLVADPLFRDVFEHCRVDLFSWKHNLLSFCVKYRLTLLLDLGRRFRAL